jgi:hypothetical protein
VQRVGEDVGGGLAPRHELAVVPDPAVAVGHRHRRARTEGGRRAGDRRDGGVSVGVYGHSRNGTGPTRRFHGSLAGRVAGLQRLLVLLPQLKGSRHHLRVQAVRRTIGGADRTSFTSRAGT